MAILATAPPPGGRVLDLCCGSGGKTLGLAASLENRGTILACDVHAARVRGLRGRLRRAGADNVRPMHLDGSPESEQSLADFARRADRILVDAPCSGLGTIRRHPDIKWRRIESDLLTAAALQADILAGASAHVGPAGRLVYAVCSPEPEEGGGVVSGFLADHPDFELQTTLCTAPPTDDEDAHYAAVMVRR